MPPVIIAVAGILSVSIATATTIVVSVITIGLNFAIQGLSSLFMKKPSSQPTLMSSDSKVSVRQAIAPRRVVYGRQRVGGTLVFISTSGAANEYLHLVIVLATHAIKSVDKFFLDGVSIDLANPVTAFGISGFATTAPYANLVYCDFRFGDPNNTAFVALNAALPGLWTANHRLRGCAAAYVQLKWDQNAFPNGVPQISFEISGKSDIYDPRTATTGYSTNAALCVRDYLANPYFGMNAQLAEFDDAAFIAAANTCDEAVSLKAGGTEPRYSCNGYFDVSMAPAEVLRALLSASAGQITNVGGLWAVWPAAYRAPTLPAFTDNDLRGQLKVNTLRSRRDLFNSVKGTYLDPAQNWSSGDFPVVSNATYVAQDGGEQIFADLQLPFTISVACAQRLAKIALERNRRQITASAPMKLSGYKAQPPDVIQFTRTARFGWTNKTFEVTNLQFAIQEDGKSGIIVGADLALQETDAAAYAWDPATDETTIAAATGAPAIPTSRTVADPTGLALASGPTVARIGADGVTINRLKVTWTAPADQLVLDGGKIECQFKKHADVNWSDGFLVDGSQVVGFIEQVLDNQAYDVRIRCRNGLGAYGAWVAQNNYTTTTANSAINSNGVAPNLQYNNSNDATVNSIDAGASATARVFGTGGVGTGYSRFVGPSTFSRPSATFLGKGYTTHYFVVYDGATHQILTTYSATLVDTYEQVGSLTTVAAGGGGGTSGGGGTGGGSFGRILE